VSIENVLARLRMAAPSKDAVTDITPVHPYGSAARSRNGSETAGVTGVTEPATEPQVVTAVTEAKRQALQREPYGQAACTAVTAETDKKNEEVRVAADASGWLAVVAALLDTTPAELIATGVILPEEVTWYSDRAPEAFAAAIRRLHPGRFSERDPDDRRHCRTCQHLVGSRCQARRLFVMDDLPRRCFEYLPKDDDPDQCTGRDRWPELLIPLETTA
jgi:hypothetical protein